MVGNLSIINESGLPDNTILDWFQNYPDSIENRLKTLGPHGEFKMTDIVCLVLFEPNLVVKNECNEKFRFYTSGFRKCKVETKLLQII